MFSRVVRVATLFLPWLAGCRVPAISAEPSAREYAVWHDVLAFETESTHPQTVVVSPETLQLDEGQLQFQRCLPPHMRAVFDTAPTATLSVNVPEDWLRMPGGQSAVLGRTGSISTDGTTMFLRLSRVASSRFRQDGYLWVEHRICTTQAGNTHCDEREGKLLRVVRDGDRWAAEETDCGAIALGEGS